MEKSSEKVIGTNKLSPNPFNNLLSEVQIKINQPKSTKKIENYALEIDSNIDKSGSNINSQPHQQAKKENHSESNSKITHHNVYVINAPLKTKNSSDTLHKEKTQKDIIDEWIIGYMRKRHILGLHWEENLAEKQRQLQEFAFYKLKQNKQQIFMKTYSLDEKVQKLTQICNYLQNSKIKQFFNILKQFYKDDLLFGLSNTMGEQKDHSLMLKIDSEYESLSIQSKNFKKQVQNNKFQQYSFSDHSQSNKNLTKKASESGSYSEDLSNLILNHNKVKLQDQLNKSVPNIPKNKASQRSIKTNKQLGDLCLQTKKQINSLKKLGDDQGLPLQSNKNLMNAKKELASENQIKNHEKQAQGNKPITITMVLNYLNTPSIVKGSNNRDILIKAQNIQNNQEVFQKQLLSDQNIINKLPFAESFYQNTGGNIKNIQFTQKIEPQKRSTSLQIKHGYVPLFPQKFEFSGNNSSVKQIFMNQYYPEQCNRENHRFTKENIPIINEKVRPKSATPKITFTFTSSTNNNPDIHTNIVNKNPIQSRVTSQNSIHPQYEQHDYIVESVLNHHNQVIKPTSGPERIKHKLLVISPSRNAQSPKRMVAPNKMALDNREHIKNNILPPAFNDYYGAQNGQKSLKPQKSIGKFVIMENQIIYSENFQKSTVHNSIFGCSVRQSNLNYQAKQQVRMKSPKDKIFVTYASPCNF